MQSIAIDAIEKRVRAALGAAHGITLLRGILQDETVQTVHHLLRALVTPAVSAEIIAEAYSRAFNALATAANNEEMIHGLSDAWQAYLLARILEDTNPWSAQAEKVGAAGISDAIRAQAERDLRALRRLFDLTAHDLWNLVHEIVTTEQPELDDAWIPWLDLTPAGRQQRLTARDTLGQRMAETDDWTRLVDCLSEHWSHHGTGFFARYHVLRWEGRNAGLKGIAHPDPIRLENLIGYEREQHILKTNIERFLRGLPAHDTVLYGAPGTGKSSTVKALANTYADRGLRLVEVRKETVRDLAAIAALLRERAPRFLLFIDDLSFEDHETEYKALKVLLEGAAEARPHNVLIYATTNRLNLIRENFSDRGSPADDVNWRDTMDEKNSLIARFGLRVTFATPNQERYLKIVTEMARQRGLDLPEDELRARALAWERQHSNRSGRTARQFIDELEAQCY
ncbi:MAG: ATP-binding protein [Ktedonobacteraceae bacterium]|nr:ATP-binding protein [Ktedonobacteraceae bacterium]